jgi:hypothetical protein
MGNWQRHKRNEVRKDKQPAYAGETRGMALWRERTPVTLDVGRKDPSTRRGICYKCKRINPFFMIKRLLVELSGVCGDKEYTHNRMLWKLAGTS